MSRLVSPLRIEQHPEGIFRLTTELLGPFRCWVHEHTFLARDGHTIARDDVAYAVPGGRLLHDLFVREDLERLFSYPAPEWPKAQVVRVSDVTCRPSTYCPALLNDAPTIPPPWADPLPTAGQ